MKKTAIVTGISGQDGAYLANLLLKKNYDVVGIAPIINNKELWRLGYLGIKNGPSLIKGDITDGNLIKRILKKYKPEEFYNLAGQSSVSRSWANPSATFYTNGYAVIMILEALRRYSPQTRFFQCSSAEIYGDTSEIVTEKYRRFEPVNPYGISKLAAHLSVENFRKQYGIFAVNGVLFNHESPLRSDFMVSKKIVAGVAKISLGFKKKLILGNVNVYRDWGYAGEFVKAMWLTLQQSSPQDFVICTGVSLPITEFIKEAFNCVGITDWKSFVSFDKKLFRKMDVLKMVGSPKRIKRILGWKQKTDLKKLVQMMIDYEFTIIKKNI